MHAAALEISENQSHRDYNHIRSERFPQERKQNKIAVQPRALSNKEASCVRTTVTILNSTGF